MPGGYIYITRQMVALANSEAELAAGFLYSEGLIAVGDVAGEDGQQNGAHCGGEDALWKI